MSKAERVTSARAPFDDAVLVCGKCARKLAKAGEKRNWRGELKRALKGGRFGRVRVVETRCLDLCPKGRQVLASGAALAGRRLAVLGPQASVDEALELLLPARRPAAETGLIAEA